MQRRAAADTLNESTVAAAASVTPASIEPLTVAAAAATSSRGSTSGNNNPMPLSSSAATDAASRSETAACNSCVRLLQHVLSDPESKPARLLHSMMNTSSNVSSRITNRQSQHELLFQATPDGVRVQIPVETTALSSSSDQEATLAALPQQSAAFVAPETVTTEPLLRRFTRLGWSATTTTSSSSSTGSNSTTAFSPDLQSQAAGTPLLATSASRRQRPPQQPTTEWMSLQCRTCADTGPEGNARAFVMGPTPLSIVVCHNRLVSAAVTAAPTAPFSSSFRSSNTATAATTATINPAAISEMEEILTHELTHIYDVRQLHLNLQSCHDLAYSEVRAAREAECAHLATCSTSAFPAPSVLLFGAAKNGNANTNASTSGWNPQKECVRNIATTATRNLFARNRANRCVQDVLDRAYADQRPFMATSTSVSGSGTTTTAAATATSSAPTNSTMASNTSATTPVPALDHFAAATKQRQPLHVVSER